MQPMDLGAIRLPPITPQLHQPRLALQRLIVDVTAWRDRGEEQLGSKPKRWLDGPDGRRWLFKESTSNRTRSGARYLRGEDWAEAISADIGRLLGLPTATVELATHEGVPGLVSLSVAPRGWALVHGNEVLSGFHPDYAQHDSRLHPLHTVENVMRLMQDVGPVLDAGLPAPQAFAGYLLLDALVGNTDRHHENWAVLRSKRHGLTRLAPSFDHSSALGFLISDEERGARLDGADLGRSVQSFVERARAPWFGTADPLSAARAALARLPPATADDLIERVVAVTPGQLLDVVLSVPLERMSNLARRFAYEMLVLNRRRLVDGG